LDDGTYRFEEWRTSREQRLLVMRGEMRSAMPSDVAEQLQYMGAELELDRQGRVIAVSLQQARQFQGRHAAYLEPLKQLSRIDARYSGFTDSSLKRIGQLENIQELNLDSSRITDRGLQYLKPLKKLKSLNLSNLVRTQASRVSRRKRGEFSPGGLTDAGMVHLQQIPTLESLDIRLSQVTNRGLSHLLGLGALSHLALPEKVDDDGLALVSQIGSLNSLDVNSCFITDVGVTHLLKMQQLESLRIDATYIPVEALARLKTLPNLSSLAVTFGDVDNETLMVLKTFDSLTELECAFSGIGDLEVTHFSDMKRLRVVNLAGTEITDQALAHLKSLGQLEELILFSTQISDVGLAHLAELTELKTLNLGNTRITDAGLVYLKSLSKLEQLGLESNFKDVYHLQNGNPVLGELGVLTNLRRVVLDLSFAARRDIEKLGKALPKCKIEYSRTLAD